MCVVGTQQSDFCQPPSPCGDSCDVLANEVGYSHLRYHLKSHINSGHCQIKKYKAKHYLWKSSIRFLAAEANYGDLNKLLIAK